MKMVLVFAILFPAWQEFDFEIIASNNFSNGDALAGNLKVPVADQAFDCLCKVMLVCLKQRRVKQIDCPRHRVFLLVEEPDIVIPLAEGVQGAGIYHLHRVSNDGKHRTIFQAFSSHNSNAQG